MDFWLGVASGFSATVLIESVLIMIAVFKFGK